MSMKLTGRTVMAHYSQLIGLPECVSIEDEVLHFRGCGVYVWEWSTKSKCAQWVVCFFVFSWTS